MSLPPELADARAAAESRFTETFTAYTVAKVLDEATGGYVDTETAMYAGVSGRVKFPSGTVSEPSQPGQVRAVQDIEVHVAVGATPNVAVNVLWRVTDSTADATLVTLTFRTKGIPQSGQTSAHRYPVESVT